MDEDKVKKLVEYFYDVCSLCDELDIYEHEALDEEMQSMKSWVDENFKR
jgi:hypothetical protein